MREQPIRRELFLYTLERTLRHATVPVQVIVRADDDDADTIAWVRERTPYDLVVGPAYGYRGLPRYFNEMVTRVHPETTAIMCGNDDMRFETPDWAAMMCGATRRYPRGLFNLGVMTFPGGAFPFSCVSPKMVDALGRLNREDLVYSDIYLRDVHARLGCCELVPAVEILHIGYASADAMAVKEAVGRDYWHHHAACVAEDVATLRPLLTRTSVGWRRVWEAWA